MSQAGGALHSSFITELKAYQAGLGSVLLPAYHSWAMTVCGVLAVAAGVIYTGLLVCSETNTVKQC